MWKRIELHNHTIESDGAMTVGELISFLKSQDIHSFSLTDHNTVSGWNTLENLCGSGDFAQMEFIRGYELTSYYGHMLCQNFSKYIPWDDIDENNADVLFRRVHEAGGLAGPAHPFSIPAPFSNGMRWTMKIHDYNLMDFIEIINNAHPMEPDNREAILWWEQLIFSGYLISTVSGLDLHRPHLTENYFTTYFEVDGPELFLPLTDQFDHAVRRCRTCVTRGPVIQWKKYGNSVTISLITRPEVPERESGLVQTRELGSGSRQEPHFICQFRMAGKILEAPIIDGNCVFSLPFPEKNGLAAARAATIMLFDGQTGWEHLTAVAGPVYL